MFVPVVDKKRKLMPTTPARARSASQFLIAASTLLISAIALSSWPTISDAAPAPRRN